MQLAAPETAAGELRLSDSLQTAGFTGVSVSAWTGARQLAVQAAGLPERQRPRLAELVRAQPGVVTAYWCEGTPRSGGTSQAGARRGRRDMMAGDTRSRLLEGALQTLRTRGIAGASARSIAATAGVNQALVFYHFRSVDELLAAAVRHGAQQRVSVYRDRLDSITSLRELLDLGRSLHADERAASNLAVLAQMLAGAQTDARLRPATAAGLGVWVAEIETILGRILDSGPLAGVADIGGLARVIAAVFIGLELYDGVDTDGAGRAMSALEQLAALTTMLEDPGPATRKTI